MSARTIVVAATLALAAPALAAPQSEAPLCRGDGTRLALLVGNQSYTGAMQPLANPRRDVAAFGKLLCDNGFTVYRHADLDIASFDGAVGGFAAASKGAKTTLVYYSGHGFAAGRQNWLAPVDAGVGCADIGDEDAADTTRLRRRLVNLDEDVLRRLDPRSDQIVILDACRTDPVRGCKGGGGSPSLVKGFSRTPAGGGRLVVYATQDRQPALDVVEGADTSPLMTAMLRRFAADPRRDWLPAFGEVTREVASLTRNRQLPNLDVGIPPTGCLAASCEAVRIEGTAAPDPAVLAFIAASSDRALLERFRTSPTVAIRTAVEQRLAALSAFDVPAVSRVQPQPAVPIVRPAPEKASVLPSVAPDPACQAEFAAKRRGGELGPQPDEAGYLRWCMARRQLPQNAVASPPKVVSSSVSTAARSPKACRDEFALKKRSGELGPNPSEDGYLRWCASERR